MSKACASHGKTGYTTRAEAAAVQKTREQAHSGTAELVVTIDHCTSCNRYYVWTHTYP
jgi:hypothetical protein